MSEIVHLREWQTQMAGVTIPPTARIAVGQASARSSSLTPSDSYRFCRFGGPCERG